MDIYQKTLYGSVVFGVFLIFLSIIFYLLINDIGEQKEKAQETVNIIGTPTPLDPINKDSNSLQNTNGQGEVLDPEDPKIVTILKITTPINIFDENINSINNPLNNINNVLYEIEINGTWNKRTHQGWYPEDAYFSPLVAWSYAGKNKIWNEGEVASAGIEAFVETDVIEKIKEELDQYKNTGFIHSSAFGKKFSAPGKNKIILKVSRFKSSVSVISGIKPSPDFFVAVNDIELFKNGEFINIKTIPVLIYDAGTDAGNTFTSKKQDENPKLFIKYINGQPENKIAEITFRKVTQ